jgi:crotonobetainyl-CoA:carnitine CoA-transferase CaiB-like acyl-CoA transferase
VAAYILGVSYLEVAVNGRDPQPVGNDWEGAAPHNIYPCAGEDRWCVIAVETDDQWRRLCSQLGHPELASNPRYATHLARRAHRTEIDALVAAWTCTRAPRAIMHELQADGIPCGAVLSGEELFVDPQLRARGIIATVEHPLLGTMPYAAIPLHVSDADLLPARPGPLLGEHNAYVLCDILGYSAEQLAAWRQDGIAD